MKFSFLEKVKIWWLGIGYPWFKTNWWVVLLLPVLAVVATAWFMSRFVNPFVIDPVAPADDRAKEELKRRFAEMAAEKTRLTRELSDLRMKYTRLEVDFDKQLEARIDELRNDPEKLRQAMLAAGRV